MISLVVQFFLITQILASKYPNEIMDTPVVLCEPERMVIKIRTSSSNPSHIYADDFAEDPDCSSRNMNKVALRHGKCGMSTEKTDNPSGIVQRVCVSVQLHPLFVTESDRSYCAQCVYVESHVLDDFEQTLDISDATPTELTPQFDMNDMPKCSYTIRKESESGPEVHYATIGDSVFHVWHCDGENLGILVQNCHVEDGQGNRILIIDQNGCGVDHYVMATPEYNSRLSMAFQETHVFKFAQKTITRFICQIRICLQGEDCKKLSPPSSCPTLEERLAKAKKLRDVPQTGIKEIYKSVGIYSSTENSVTSDTLSQMREVHPPASKPDEEVKKNTTLGYIYYGYGFDSHRQRRDILINQSELNRKPRFSTSKGYPEIDLVGELRVLDSPEDVKYYEERSSSALSNCVFSLTYSILITILIVVSILLITLILLLTFKTTNHKNKSVRFAP